jgi:iron complex outermembrane recepter protein
MQHRHHSLAKVIGLVLYGSLATPGMAAEPPLEEVVVTGTRVARNGFEAPTPTTVIGTAEIEARGSTNITEIINEVPAFRPSQTPAAATRGGANPSGSSFLDLRGLNGQGSAGVARTLVLVDGRRFVSSTGSGQVDVNLIPTSLIQRTEIVTGGASAAWGSDAVTGVVNLILKDRLQGIESSVSYGWSAENDNKETAASFAAGTSFAEGRGHIILGVEYVDGKGAPDPYVSRDWSKKSEGVYSNGTPRAAGVPERTNVSDIRFSDQATPGGIIFGGPLDNIMFLGGQQTAVFQPGFVTPGNTPVTMVGGGPGVLGNEGVYFTGGSNLVSPIERYAALSRLNYELTDNITATLEVSRGATVFSGFTASRRDTGTNLTTVGRGNPFLPASILQEMITRKLQTISVGRVAYDDNFGFYKLNTDQTTDRAVFVLQGDLPGDWAWDAYYQWGTNTSEQVNQSSIKANYAWAVSAVRDVNGNIVCGEPLSAAHRAFGAPDPGCVPFNIFGKNSPSQAAVNYVRGTWTNDLVTRQRVAAVNLTGTPFSVWAGPVSVATGLEYRKEEANSATDANSQANRFDLGNPKPLNGEYFTKEIYGEAVVPLLADKSLARSLDLNAAIRRTDYSTSGNVVTWKAGLSWEPIASLRFRGTKSRDIRAPNINELYSLDIFNRVGVTNPFTGAGSTQVDQFIGGNANLIPEEADTVTAGVVFQPTWAPRIRGSVDYYEISIADVISSFGAQTIVDRCFLSGGTSSLCSSMTFNPDKSINSIRPANTNFDLRETAGLDIELGYDAPIDAISLPGRLMVRAFATQVTKLNTISALTSVNSLGTTVPEWGANLSMTYTLGRATTTAQVRFIGKTVENNDYIAAGEPGYNSALINTIDVNSRPDVYYFNLSGQYNLLEGEGTNAQVYGVINNVFDKDPPAGTGLNVTGASLYDIIGRGFRLGLRFSF